MNGKVLFFRMKNFNYETIGSRILITKLLFLSVLSINCLADQTRDLSIGVMLCQSGNCSDWGNSALKGSRLAIEKINANGGVLDRNVKLVVEDTDESISGAKAVTAYHSLRRQNLQFIIGPSWSPGALAILPLVSKSEDLILITPSASAKEFSRASPFIFNMRPPEDIATKALAKFAFDRGHKHIAIFSSQQPAESTQGRVFAEEFTRLGGIITIIIEAIPTQVDLRTEALRIVNTKPDAIFLMNYNQIETGLKELSKLKYKGLKMAISLDDLRIKNSEGIMEGIIVSKAVDPSEEFQREFRMRYNEKPGLSAEGGYDAVMCLVQAIKKGGDFDIAKIRNELQSGKYRGAIGDFTFNESREVIGVPIISIVKDGALQELQLGGLNK